MTLANYKASYQPVNVINIRPVNFAAYKVEVIRNQVNLLTI